MSLIGRLAPKFVGKGYSPVQKKFIDISLDQYKGKYLLLNFYPFDFTFVCPTEIRALDKLKGEFQKRNCELLVASCDSIHAHKAFVDTATQHGGFDGNLSIDLLSDYTKTIGRDYGVLDHDGQFTHRGSFLIDPEQKLRAINVTDTNVGRNMEEFVRLVEAFEFSAKNGDVCPAQWKKTGDATLTNNHSDEKTKTFWKKSF